MHFSGSKNFNSISKSKTVIFSRFKEPDRPDLTLTIFLVIRTFSVKLPTFSSKDKNIFKRVV